MKSEHTNIRLFTAHALETGLHIPLEGKQHHYLVHVMRQKEGGKIALFNGQDGEYISEITAITRHEVTLTVREQLRPFTPSPAATLLCAPLKSGHFETMIQKATELGIAQIQPIKTDHSVISRINIDRLQHIAIEASEQCERLDVPSILPLLSFDQWLYRWPEDTPIFAGDESGTGTAAHDVLSALNLCSADENAPVWAIMVGPEGGFSANEMQQLRVHPATHMLSLGPRILRADTAATTLLSLTMAQFGDWEHKPAFRAVD